MSEDFWRRPQHGEPPSLGDVYLAIPFPDPEDSEVYRGGEEDEDDRFLLPCLWSPGLFLTGNRFCALARILTPDAVDDSRAFAHLRSRARAGAESWLDLPPLDGDFDQGGLVAFSLLTTVSADFLRRRRVAGLTETGLTQLRQSLAALGTTTP